MLLPGIWWSPNTIFFCSDLHGRLILATGDALIKNHDLRAKLSSLWKPIGQWGMIFLGKGLHEFSFSSLEDLHSVQAIGIWNLKPGSLRLFLWIKDFNPDFQRNSNA